MDSNKQPTAMKKTTNFLLSLYHNQYLRFVLFGLLLACLPQLAKMKLIKTGVVTTMAQILIYAIAALGLNLLLGYSGLISLGTAGFMGLGAYVAAYFYGDLQLSFWIALLAAVAIPTLIGTLVGLTSLRISGFYLAIATLCVSEILLKTFQQATDLTGGTSGKNISYPVIFDIAFKRDTMYLLLVVALVLVMMLTWNLVNGQFGRAMHAMRGSEVAAQAMGVSLLKYRLLVFAIATAYAGLSGALYVFFVKGTYPTTWVLNLSLNILAAVVIGGVRSIYGTVLGVFVVWGVSDLFLNNIPFFRQNPQISFIVNGVLIILVVMFYPNGLGKLPSDLKAGLSRLLGGRKKPGIPNKEER